MSGGRGQGRRALKIAEAHEREENRCPEGGHREREAKIACVCIIHAGGVNWPACLPATTPFSLSFALARFSAVESSAGVAVVVSRVAVVVVVGGCVYEAIKTRPSRVVTKKRVSSREKEGKVAHVRSFFAVGDVCESSMTT